MNILVLGSKGQLGVELQMIHKHSPHSFTFTDRAELDITSAPAMEAYLEAQPTDIIINCAAYTQVDQAEADTTTAELVNHHSVAIVASLSAERNIHLIHISTDYVFDGRASTPYAEDALASPLNVYGWSKFRGEEAIRASGCAYTIIRTSWLYSAHGHNFVRTMLRLQSERPSLQVVYDQIGSPTYARDLAQYMLYLIAYGKPSTSEIYHYTNEGVCSWYDFACAIAELSGSPCQITSCRSSAYPTLAPRPAYSVLDKGKCRASLPYPIPHWRTSLTECLTLMLTQQQSL